MRIEGWRVDGYGVLSAHEVTGIGPGLTVVLGPNESGKSTLLEFVRGVLVGFPDARRRGPRHEPVNGGRHGGALHVVDDDGRFVTLERYVGARQPVATAPLQDPAAAAEMVTQLGAADGAVFRSVFAFGLDELRGLGALAGDDLKDLLFSAGVLGAGRSATAALRVLSDDRAKIVRARHADARANRAHKQLQEVERSLRAARDEARSYPAGLAELDRLASEVERCREALDTARRRQASLERMGAVWPVWHRRAEALAELEAHAGDPADPTLAVAPRIRNAAAQLSGHEARLERLDELERSRASLCERVAELEERLGPGWDEARARGLDGSIVSVDALRGHARRLDQAADAVAFQEGRLREAVAGEEAVRPRAQDREPRPASEIEADRDALRSARALLSEAAHRARAGAGVRDGRGPWARVVLALAAALAAGAGAAALARRTDVAAACLASLAVLALAWAAVAAVTRRSPAGAHLDPLDSRLADVAARLGTSLPLSTSDLDAREARLDVEWQERLRAEEASRAVREAADSVGRERRALALAEEQLVAARANWRRWTAQQGLPAASPGAVEEIIGTAAALAGKAEALRRVEAEITRTAATVGGYERLLEELSGRPAPFAAGGARAVVDQLEERLGRAIEDRDRLQALGDTVAACDQQLHDLLGSGPAAEAFRAELLRGDVAGWDAEGAMLRLRVTELQAAHESAVRAHQDYARHLEALAGSDTIARLEMERAGLEESLWTELREWWVLGLAKSLIEETLARYERERQPAVVARAAQLFATVTEGRYVHLVPRSERDGAREHTIDVVDAAGRRLEATVLSRGTVEQLYLCLRLALAEVFAARVVRLPFVLDDVLVNFDPDRARAVVRVLEEVAERHQVLLFTCHPHLAALAGAAKGTVGLVELHRREEAVPLLPTATRTGHAAPAPAHR